VIVQIPRPAFKGTAILLNPDRNIAMKNILVSTAVAILVLAPLNAQAMGRPNAQQCNAWFSSLDRNGDGSLGTNEKAATYYSKITLAGEETHEDQIMGKAFFIAECKVGSFGKMQG
jgi:hypothetical protein